MSLTSLLFRIARLAAWNRAFSRGPGAVSRRARNRYILSRAGPWLRK
jgi:hypothetical protein